MKSVKSSGSLANPTASKAAASKKMILAGRIEEVAWYCETDVLNTYRVWLVYELFRGSITADELHWSEVQIRELIESRRSENPHLRAAVGLRSSSASIRW